MGPAVVTPLEKKGGKLASMQDKLQVLQCIQTNSPTVKDVTSELLCQYVKEYRCEYNSFDRLFKNLRKESWFGKPDAKKRRRVKQGLTLTVCNEFGEAHNLTPEQKLRLLQLQVTCRLTLYTLLGKEFLQFYQTKQCDATGNTQQSDLQQRLLDDLVAILSKAAFSLSHNEQFSDFMQKCVPLDLAKKLPRSLVYGLFESFEIDFPYSSSRRDRDKSTLRPIVKRKRESKVATVSTSSVSKSDESTIVSNMSTATIQSLPTKVACTAVLPKLTQNSLLQPRNGESGVRAKFVGRHFYNKHTTKQIVVGSRQKSVQVKSKVQTKPVPSSVQGQGCMRVVKPIAKKQQDESQSSASIVAEAMKAIQRQRKC